MVDIRQPEYQLAAGYNLPGLLTTLEGVEVDADDYPRTFPIIRAYGSYDEGVRRIRGDGTAFFSGYATVNWVFPVLTRKQEEYLRATYCAGEYSGKVTVRTTTDDDADSFANYNAVMMLPKLSEQDWRGSRTYNYIARFTRLDVI